MKVRLFILVIFIIYVYTSGKNQYIHCYEHIKEYKKIYTEVNENKKKLKEVQASLDESHKRVSNESLSLYKNRTELVTTISTLPNVTLVEISALEINNHQSILYMAKTNDIADVEYFTDKINGIQIDLESEDIGKTLNDLSLLNCIIYDVIIDKDHNIISVQILSIKE